MLAEKRRASHQSMKGGTAMVWWYGLGRKQHVGPDWYRANGRIGTCVRWGSVVAARVKGRRENYVVFGSPRALDCSCRARRLPCPHVLAVGEELEQNAVRFVDLGAALERHAGEPADAEAIVRLLLSHPSRVLDALERGELASLAGTAAPAASVA